MKGMVINYESNNLFAMFNLNNHAENFQHMFNKAKAAIMNYCEKFQAANAVGTSSLF